MGGARGHRDKLRGIHLRDLFADDPARGETFAIEVEDLYVDYSKHLVTDETMALLVVLAERAKVPDRIRAMFAGERINVTEDRPVLHVALRAPPDEVIEVDGVNVVPEVHSVLTEMAGSADRVRSGGLTGSTGRRIRSVRPPH